MAWEHLENPYQYSDIMGSVIVAKVAGEFEDEHRCLPYRAECDQEGNIIFTSERRASYKNNFLFKPFAFTEDWITIRRWNGPSIDERVKETELRSLDNILDVMVPYFLISRNGKIWATEEGIRLADKYEGHAFLTFIEICRDLYFDCKKDDWDPYWDDI